MNGRSRFVSIAAALALAACAALSGCGPRTQSRAPQAPPEAPPAYATTAPSVVESPLDGQRVSRAVASERPIAVIIDNHPAARPQWGLSGAVRVYESLTEGPVTRYLAVFAATQDVERVGPVRSIRTQFLNYVLETGAALAHVGGNADALDLIPVLHVTTLNEFAFPRAYRRIRHRGIAYEHTVFTSTAALRAAADQQSSSELAAVTYRPWKDDAPPAQRPRAQIVTINFSDPRFLVRWLYHRASNDYVREMGGAPDVDAGTGLVVRASAISIVVVPRVEGRTLIHEDTWAYDDVGSGPAWVVEDGKVLPATWHKPSRSARLSFSDRQGVEIPMTRGPQWIEIIPPTVTPIFFQ